MTREMALASIGRALAVTFPGRVDEILDAAFYDAPKGPTGFGPHYDGLILRFEGTRGEQGERFVRWDPSRDFGSSETFGLGFLPQFPSVDSPIIHALHRWHLTIFFPSNPPKGT